LIAILSIRAKNSAYALCAIFRTLTVFSYQAETYNNAQHDSGNPRRKTNELSRNAHARHCVEARAANEMNLRGPMFKHNEAFSFQIATDDQQETDRYWNAIVGNGGQESECGWCKDKWGVSWQITPRVLTEALAAGGGEAKRAFEAMMGMKKIDVAAIKAARRG
jgi:predicted 3-demethylubiquinone-9 3-methyltransferase (glyoxalase superfamily)